MTAQSVKHVEQNIFPIMWLLFRVTNWYRLKKSDTKKISTSSIGVVEDNRDCSFY
jgi:hypothetical protein